MNDLTQLLRVTPAIEVAKKWNVSSHRLNEIIEKYGLPLYSVREKRIRPGDGETIYFCSEPHFKFYYEGDYGHGDYVLEGEYFSTDTVEAFEVSYPEILWNVAPAEGEIEYVPAEKLRKELGLSPVCFVDYLRNNSDLALFGNGVDDDSRQWFYNNASREQAVDLLDNMCIHHLDIVAHKKRLADEKAMSDVPFSSTDNTFGRENQSTRITELETELAEAQRQLEGAASLRQWNKRLNDQNQELRSELAAKDTRIAELDSANSELSTTTRTQAATEARQGMTIAAWQAAFKIMIPVILQCHAEGEKKRTKIELQSMCSKHGGKLTPTQLEFLRERLGPCHVNTDGGPTVQD